MLSYLLSTTTRDVMAQVTTAKTSSQLWAAVEHIFSSQMRARSVNTQIALATTKKGNSFANELLTKMKTLTNDMAAAGKPLGEDEFMSYILTGLDEDYNPLVSAVLASVEPISYTELLSQIISFVARLEMQRGGAGSHSSVNSASHGGHEYNRGGGNGG